MTKAPPPSKLIAYYPFENGAVDRSGNDKHGTIHGNPTPVKGYRGKAYHFDGRDGYISTSLDMKPTLYPQLTIGAWVKAQKFYERVVLNHGSGHRNLVFTDLGWGAGTGFGRLGYIREGGEKLGRLALNILSDIKAPMITTLLFEEFANSNRNEKLASSLVYRLSQRGSEMMPYMAKLEQLAQTDNQARHLLKKLQQQGFVENTEPKVRQNRGGQTTTQISTSQDIARLAKKAKKGQLSAVKKLKREKVTTSLPCVVGFAGRIPTTVGSRIPWIVSLPPRNSSTRRLKKKRLKSIPVKRRSCAWKLSCNSTNKACSALKRSEKT